jgi:accessory gene regulator B
MNNKGDISTKISYYLAEVTDKDQDILLFGLRLITTTILGYFLLILFALPFDAVWQTLVASVTVSVFRVFSGGAHATAQIRCSLIGVIVLVPIGALAKNIGYLLNPSIMVLLGVIFISGLMVIYLYVPADTPGKPINSAVQKKYLRRIAYILFLSWTGGIYFCLIKNIGLEQGFIIASVLGMYWQVFSLTPAGYTSYKSLDGLLKLFHIRKEGIE